MKNYIWLIAAAAVLVAMVGWVIVRGTGGSLPLPTPTPTADEVTPTPTPSAVISISMASSSTKKEWLDEAISTFNDSSKSDDRL